ncbi:MAG: 4Fe-4S dicluster domain-containing protein [Bacteroidota bacterium]|nr:4Fe-4S dicluster domain-containing protein [Bacteroidota bacterium]
MELKLISSANLQLFFEKLLQSGKIMIAPVLKPNGKVYFQPVKAYSDVATDYIQTVFSAKSVVFPKVETLFAFTKKDGKITLTNSLDNIPETVIWGLRPCDASAFDYLSDFFLRENPDSYFKTRKDRTTLVTFSCSHSDEACFCTSVGLNPGSTIGSDLQMTVMNKEVYVEILTEKGKQASAIATSLFSETETKDKAPFLANPVTRFSMDAIKDKMKQAYDSAEWKHLSLGCFSCGACAFSCPTCSCFDIQDEGTQDNGKRLRCWDACGFGLFTKHSSGHNPKPTQVERRRQRLMHKFHYSVENLGRISCVGCGRCIRICPAHLNIFENILSVTKD